VIDPANQNIAPMFSKVEESGMIVCSTLIDIHAFRFTLAHRRVACEL
jgi:hypothetical protein